MTPVTQWLPGSAFSPAAAWYFAFSCYRFFACRRKIDNSTDRSYALCRRLKQLLGCDRAMLRAVYQRFQCVRSLAGARLAGLKSSPV
jgi:hypothetical protein